MGFVNSANILCVVFPIERDEIKKAQHLWRCAPLNILTQGSSLRSLTLGYQKRNPYGVRLPHKKRSFCAALPFEREVSSDMVSVISYRMWLRRRVNPTGVPFFIAQGWRGTSLPWVSIRKEIQRHRC